MQLSLLRPPALELTERGRSVPPHVLGLYSVLLSHVRELRCGGRVAGVGRRLRWSNDRGWKNADVRRLLGIDRRNLQALERWGLVTWDGDTLVLPRYHRSAEWRDETEDDRRRRQTRAAGIKSGAARRRGAKQLEFGDSEVGGDPSRNRGVIRDVVLSVFAELERTPVRTPLTPLPPGGQIRDRGPGDPPLGSDSDPGRPSKKAPSGPHLILKRVAVASAPGTTVANRVVRRPRAEESGARTGRSTCAPRGASFPKQGDVKAAAARGAKRPGGPDFKLWYDWVRRTTGVPYWRAEAEARWDRLEMTADERRWAWRRTAREMRTWRDGRRPPNAAELIRTVLEPDLRLRRRKGKRAEPTPAADLVDNVYDDLKRRQSR